MGKGVLVFIHITAGSLRCGSISALHWRSSSFHEEGLLAHVRQKVHTELYNPIRNVMSDYFFGEIIRILRAILDQFRSVQTLYI
jgi:hypothetical protein